MKLLCLVLFACLVAGAAASWRDGIPRAANISGLHWTRQDYTYDCGAAAFQMTFQQAGRYVQSQDVIIDVLRVSPLGGAWAADESRGTFFSSISSAFGSVFPDERATAGWYNYVDTNPSFVPGLGVVSYQLQPATCDLQAIKKLVADGYVVLPMVYFYYNSTSTGTLYYYGHFRPIFGYDDRTSTLNAADPWGRDGVPNVFQYTYDQFCGELGWNYVEGLSFFIGPYWAMVVSNWELELSVTPTGRNTFALGAELDFPCPEPLCTEWDNYAAVQTWTNINMSLTLPAGCSVPHQSTTVNVGTRRSNGEAYASWEVVCSGRGPFTFQVVASGFAQGSLQDFYGFPELIYPGYSWTDIVGTRATATVSGGRDD